MGRSRSRSPSKRRHSRSRSRSRSRDRRRTDKKLKLMQDQIDKLTNGLMEFCAEFQKTQKPRENEAVEVIENQSNVEGEKENEKMDQKKGINVEFLEKLGEKIDSPDDSVKIEDGVKDWWRDWMSEGIEEEVRKDLIKKYPRDSSFRTEAPKVNLSVIRHLNEIAKKRDQHFVDTQNCVGSAIIALATAFSMGMTESEEEFDFELIMRHMWDAGKILCDVFNQQSVARKSYITPVLDKEIRPTLTSTISDEWLYGESLNDKVDEAKKIEKAAAALKTVEKPSAKKSFQKPNFSGNSQGPPARWWNRQVGFHQRRSFISPRHKTRTSQRSSPSRSHNSSTKTERTHRSSKK